MKYDRLFSQYLNCADTAATFAYLQQTLADSIKGWDYFVNWSKALTNIRNIEIDLNTLNYLIGKTDIEGEFKLLLSRQPGILRTIPILIACRDTNFQMLDSIQNGCLVYKSYSFEERKQLSTAEIHNACEFAKNSGFLDLLKNKTIKSIPDYVFGIEVGLDSNGRKNRGGTAMEGIVNNIVQEISKRHGFHYMSQATSEKIKREWNVALQVDKTDRRFDFAINTPRHLYLIETNFYSGTGSKLKATAGEYKSVFDFIANQNHKFIWITDGLGWRSTLRPLEEAFNHLDCVLNIHMAIAVSNEQNSMLLEEIIAQGL
jgi:type II restriction enzyme